MYTYTDCFIIFNTEDS